MRQLTFNEIQVLEAQRCWAENWNNILVADDFTTNSVRNTNFYGNIQIGSGVTITDVKMLKGTGKATKPLVISVLNEGGDGNIILFPGLTSQLGWLMMHYSQVFDIVFQEEADRLQQETPSAATVICNGAVIEGATKIVDCYIQSSVQAPTYIGPDVIMQKSITASGAEITDGAKVFESFVGEAVHIGKGFSSEASVFFADTYMDNGEACAALCGPFSCSHHKSTLLIGGQFSFYNAGSNTNQSNHAYKMGPIHWGILERGAKTASGCHILWPAHIGAFSMVMGKVTEHPQIADLPFSYILAVREKTYIVPGINIKTVGTWRDVNKWPKRDARNESARRDIIDFAFPNPYIIQFVVRGIALLNSLVAEQGEQTDEYEIEGCYIKRDALLKGIEYYNLALQLAGSNAPGEEWLDLCGMIAPQQDIEDLILDIDEKIIKTIDSIEKKLHEIHDDHINEINVEIDDDARGQWLSLIRQDAYREFTMGDVSEDYYNHFITTIK